MNETDQSARSPTPNATGSGNSSATTGLISAADKLHAELLNQCRELMTAEAETKDGDKLKRLAEIVSDYESHRWPIC